MTALFAEETGVHAPLDIDWTSERKLERLTPVHIYGRDVRDATVGDQESAAPPAMVRPADPIDRTAPTAAADAEPSFATFWDLARAVNRSDRAALALAHNGATTSGISIEGDDIRKLLRTMWFRGVFPRLSEQWQQRVLDVLVSSIAIPDHLLKVDHRDARLSELTFAQLSDVVKRVSVPEVARADVDLLSSVGRLWGGDAMGRFQFVPVAQNGERSRFAGLLQGLRS